MRASPSQSRIVRFGVFEVDLQEGEVRRAGLRQKLGPQPFQVLQAMLERPGEVVTRDELRERLWPEKTFVDYELALKKCINRIREILGDSAESPRFVETVPRRGYRFIAPLEQSVGASVASDNHPIAVLPVREEGTGKDNAQTAHNAAKKPAVLAILVGAIGIFILIALVITLRPFTKAKTPGEAQSIRSLAVLPLENLSGNPAEDYFADGLTDELITALAQTTDLRIISRTSVMQFKNVRRPVADIARQLNVDGIIEGTVVRSGEHVRVTAQLIQAPVDRHLWAQSYERELKDVVALQDDVARSIASAIKVRLIRNSASSVGRERSVDPEAYDTYLKGRYELNKRSPADLNRALEFFQRAIDRDSMYAPAYSGLADTYALLGAAGYDVLPVPEAMEKARAAALRAIELDDNLSQAHASLAFVSYCYDWNWAVAEKEFKRALALNPANATAHQWYSEYLADLKRWDETIVEAKAALAIDPLSLIVNENLARPYYYSRQFDKAIELSQATLRLDPRFPVAHLRLGRAYAAKGLYSEAIAEFREFSELSGDSTLALASLANAQARSGHRSDALHIIDGLKQSGDQKHVPSYQFAIAYAGLGDTDQTIQWLEQAYERRSDFLISLGVEPMFDNLRSDPRFQDLLHRIALAP